MAESIPNELASVLDDIRKQIAALSERLARLEQEPPRAGGPPVPLPVAGAERAMPQNPAPVGEPPITEQELIAISAALAAYLGVRVHIRQVRLISSRAWAQEGRVSIQASHRL